ncbi:glycosyltransferase family 2 protein [Polaromonas glacialis]|uniref:glycosyltransferase family 2 protein n=1 Tax=Polaromonas glacialis TaxID=866564 RepID=UPI0009FDA5A4|nr:glycosyltransferase family 2 protein [Polaromonas glacialis]
MTHICGIIVTYEPDFNVLAKLISAITHQIDELVVIDNASKLRYVQDQKIGTQINNTTNIGLAGAQNQGINWAAKRGASHVLIFDQDSEPENDMVKKLLDSETWLLNHGYKVAAVGPVSIDKSSGVANPFYGLDHCRYKKKYVPDFEGFIEALFLISSGQLIRMDVLNLTGYMKEELFIDYIDMEWGLRAGALGYKSYGVTFAKMFHSVGENAMVIGDVRLPMHSPIRYYYMTRNALLLYFSCKYPTRWIMADIAVLTRRTIVASILYSPRGKNINNILLGIFHGIFGRAGPKLKN